MKYYNTEVKITNEMKEQQIDCNHYDRYSIADF